MVEIRNNHSIPKSGTTSVGDFYLVQQNNLQFWGQKAIKTIKGATGSGMSVNLGTCGETYVLQKVQNAEKASDGHWTNNDEANVVGLACWVARCNGGATLDYEVRLSVYEGEYYGNYKPYVDQDVTTNLTSLTNTVNTVSQTASSNSASISQLETTVATKADSSTVTTVSNKANQIEQDLNSFKTTVSGTYATQTDLGTANANISTLQQDYSALTQDLGGFKTTVANTYATQTALGTTNQNVTAAATAASNAAAAASAAQSTADQAVQDAAAAQSTADGAVQDAAAAQSAADDAADAASAAQTTADTAATNASNAVTTANTASTNASNAVTTANTAATNASNAVTTANGASTTANTAATNASNAVTTANNAKTTAEGAATTASNAATTASNAATAASNAATAAAAAQTTANTALADGTEYINGTQTAATGAWTGVTRDATLTTGKTIAYRLPYAGSGNATLNLTLNGSTASPKPTTGAKEVYLGTTRMTTHFGAGSVINMTYDGTRWRATSIPNSNNFDRRLHNNYIKAAENLNKYTICIGTSAGYKMIKANETFNLDYLPLYLNANTATGQTYAVAKDAQTAAMYEAIPSVTVSNTATPQGAAVNKTLWLKGTVSGNTFTCAATNFLTCDTPNSADGYYYIPLGQFANNSTTAIYFSTSTRLFAYLDGYFQAIDNAANTRAAKLETTVSSHTTAIEQNATNIALKANASTTYTKTEVDNAISGVETTVANTYATKAELDVTSESVEILIEETAEIRETADNAGTAAEQAATAASAAQETADQAAADIEATTNTLSRHFVFNTDGLAISGGTSDYNVLLDEQQLSFRCGSDVLAYGSGNAFNAPVLEADEIHLGNWM